ncbi:MAG: GNAT family N-acetyltransferase [Gemmatimonadetes bacterium]|nr:GNAT family N-acetyltransferase [Gemmatimonadota bacterium]NIO32642.1 GNAT family N-acetyltransferase [Gemmatimonadota bacterium]
MTTYNDGTHLRRLETAEIAAWGDFYRAASPASAAACGLGLLEDDGTLAVRAAAADVLALNTVMGLGLKRPASDATIEKLVEFFVSARVPRFFVKVSPTTEAADIGESLTARGFKHYNNWVKLYRDTSPPPHASTDLEIRRIDEDEAPAFGRIVVSCFDWPESAASWVADMVGRDSWRHYMAFDGAGPAATGALFVSQGLAWIDFATTLPEYRGRGAQSALLAQRIRDAAELGCEGLVVETAEDRSEKPAPSFRNQLRFGFQVAYVRPNFIYYVAFSPADS